MSYYRNRLLLATVIVCLTSGTQQALAQDIGGGFATRLLSNGSIDTSFQDGVFDFDLALAAAVDGENRIIIAGTQTANSLSLVCWLPAQSTWTSGTTGWPKRGSRQRPKLAPSPLVLLDESSWQAQRRNSLPWRVSVTTAAIASGLAAIRRWPQPLEIRQKRWPSPSPVMGASWSEAGSPTGAAPKARRRKCSPSPATTAWACSIPASERGASGRITPGPPPGRPRITSRSVAWPSMQAVASPPQARFRLRTSARGSPSCDSVPMARWTRRLAPPPTEWSRPSPAATE